MFGHACGRTWLDFLTGPPPWRRPCQQACHAARPTDVTARTCPESDRPLRAGSLATTQRACSIVAVIRLLLAERLGVIQTAKTNPGPGRVVSRAKPKRPARGVDQCPAIRQPGRSRRACCLRKASQKPSFSENMFQEIVSDIHGPAFAEQGRGPALLRETAIFASPRRALSGRASGLAAVAQTRGDAVDRELDAAAARSSLSTARWRLSSSTCRWFSGSR